MCHCPTYQSQCDFCKFLVISLSLSLSSVIYSGGLFFILVVIPFSGLGRVSVTSTYDCLDPHNRNSYALLMEAKCNHFGGEMAKLIKAEVVIT